jgi:hypothetical protein
MPHLLFPQIEGGQFAGIAMERVKAVSYRKEQPAITSRERQRADRDNPLGTLPIWPDIGTALAASRTDELVLDIGYAQFIWPAISVIGRNVKVATTKVAAVDQNPAHASGAHFGEGDFFWVVYHFVSMTRDIAGWPRFLTLIQCFDRPG